jgi:hypothetical protein
MNEKSESIKIFRCNICNKIYACRSSLCNHNKKFHTSDNLYHNPHDNPYNPVDNPSDNQYTKIYKCKYCSKKFKHQQSKFRHEQKCNNKKNLSEENNLLLLIS